MDVLQTLSSLAQNISIKFHGVNSGGCCVVAGSVAKQLSSVLPNVQVRVLNYDSIPVDEVRRLTNNSVINTDWNDKGFYFNHVIVQFEYEGETYFFDSDQGPQTVKSFYYNEWGNLADGSLEIDEAIALGDNAGSWNTWFDRGQIPAMKEEISKAFH